MKMSENEGGIGSKRRIKVLTRFGGLPVKGVLATRLKLRASYLGARRHGEHLTRKGGCRRQDNSR